MKNQCKKCRAPVRTRNGIKVSSLCASCRKEKLLEKKAKHEQTKGFQQRKWKSLHKKAWTLMSQYIRLKGCNQFGENTCYTCGEIKDYKELQAGHFHHGKLDFDERNLKPQCPQCNTYKHGNLAIYGTKLAQELGIEGMEQLRLDSNYIIYSKDDLERIITELTEKLRNFEGRP